MVTSIHTVGTRIKKFLKLIVMNWSGTHLNIFRSDKVFIAVPILYIRVPHIFLTKQHLRDYLHMFTKIK